LGPADYSSGKRSCPAYSGKSKKTERGQSGKVLRPVPKVRAASRPKPVIRPELQPAVAEPALPITLPQ